MKAKHGTRLIARNGEEWEIVGHSHDFDKYLVQTHDGNRFYVHPHNLKHYAKKRRWYHRMFRKLFKGKK